VTGPYEDEESVPLRLQPVVARPDGWRGRSSGIVAVGLVAFVAVAVVLGTAFDDGHPASTLAIAAVPSTGSATRAPTTPPSPTRRPSPLPTQLPRIEVLGGDSPSEERLVDGYGLMRLDLATGELAQLASPIDYTAQLLPSGEIVCACVVRDATANGGQGSSILRFARHDPAGSPIVEKDVRSFDGTVEVPTMGEGFNVVTGLEPGGARLYALVVERRPPVWTMTLLAIDTETGEILTTIDVGDVPSNPDADASPSASPTPVPTPAIDGSTPDGTYLWPVTLVVAPGGGSAYAAVERSDVRKEVWTYQTLEWMIDLAPAPTRELRPLPAGVALALGAYCAEQPAFLDSSLLVRVCSSPPTGAWTVRRIRTDGTSAGDIVVASTIESLAPPAVVAVPAQRAVYLWVQLQHVLTRVDVDTGGITDVKVPPAMLPAGGRPIGFKGYLGASPAMVLSADGRQLFALGVGEAVEDELGAPTGIWVFDVASLALVDHWPARAYLASLATSGDGRFVYAAGAAGLDVDGRQNPWLASVTVYAADTGEIQVVYGSVAGDGWVRFLPLPEAVAP
jgi:hypothetical protein